MKRLITTLAILLVVIVAGMTALVVLVNPNDFRSYMTRQVEQRSGYRLALTGELRWHVWPQLSILSGPVSLTAPGASQPVLSAENMRLDVALLPLLSHQLAVRQVMLKGAVVRLIPDSERQSPPDAPIGPAGSSASAPLDDVTHGWSFDIAHLKIVDSLLVWQQRDGSQLNVRDFNLQLDQPQPRQAKLEVSSRINRDQRELQLTLKSDVDLSGYPRQLSGAITRFDYRLRGADLPTEGISGSASMQASWNGQSGDFSLSDLQLSANDSQLSGTLSGRLGELPQLQARLHASNLNLDALLAMPVAASTASQPAAAASRGPVIADMPLHDHAGSVLAGFNGSLALQADRLQWRGINMDGVQLAADNRDGKLTVSQFDGRSGPGSFSLPATLTITPTQTLVSVRPLLKSMPLGPLLNAFALPDSVSGELSLSGAFSGDGLTVDAFKRQWRGKGEMRLADAQIAGLNFQQLVQRAVENSSDKVRGDRQEGQPDLQQITGSATLNNGRLDFVKLDARGSALNYNGSGNVDLANRALDMNFGVTVTDGWQGDDSLVRRLQTTPVPLRIYGPWSQINYSLKVDQVLRSQLRDEAKQRLKEWMGRNPEAKNSGDANKLLKDLER
ncbi:outer membrane assembly protein AsmA [Erwinia sp. E602]|uniref:outer membrane assembly protein AsmA n=1 Tax=Erwinia sp. E602 TaxID=2675378 RepID=UPI001BA479E6|nr:outer membrane assembly protein AsmA [Erwinia sp. E602]QUG75129.1 outer membrane assembly protein AsmA [Erwinia sp. E602]